MGLRNAEQETLQRLDSKTLDVQLRQILVAGLSCSPFEADAVIAAAQEVYFPFLDSAGEARSRPGYVSLVAVAAEEPAGKAVADCAKLNVQLELHRGAEDDQLLSREGPLGFRRQRIPELCQQALSQGAVLTREDLAYRIFFVGLRTISRDLAWLCANDRRALPLRSAVQDIGPVLTHRVEVVRLALEGKTTSQICDILHHSPEAVANYLGTFTRCAQLAQQGLQSGQIAFVLRRGRGLIERYLELVAGCAQDKLWSYHLEELLGAGRASGEKNFQGVAMGAKPNYRLKKYGPLARKSLASALQSCLAKDFPQLGGARMLKISAERILEVVLANLHVRDTVRHGQVAWTGIALEHRTKRSQRIEEMRLVPLVLDLVTPEDIAAVIACEPRSQRLLRRCLRLCRQAYEQGGLLSNCDLAVLLGASDQSVAAALTAWEREHDELVPRRATLHDVGTALTHKRWICWKRYAEGKTSEQVARETYHSLQAVDRYLGQFDRIRHCRRQGLDVQQIAYVMGCSQALVAEYAAIDEELQSTQQEEHEDA